MKRQTLARLWGPVLALLWGGCSAEVASGLSEQEADTVVAALQAVQLRADKHPAATGRQGTFGVRVERSRWAEAVRALREQGLPRPQPPGLAEVFGGSGLLPTALQQQAMLQHALAGELSRTLQSVPGVVQARVHLALPPRAPLQPSPDPAQGSGRASALLRVSGDPPLTREQVQRLVAGAVAGLAPRDVAVVLLGTRAPPAGQAPAAPPLAGLGPFQVAEASRTPLLLSLLAGLGLLLAASALSLGLLARLRALRAAMTLSAEAPRAGGPPQGEQPLPLDLDLESSLGLLDRSFTWRGRAAPRGDGPRPPTAAGRDT